MTTVSAAEFSAMLAHPTDEVRNTYGPELTEISVAELIEMDRLHDDLVEALGNMHATIKRQAAEIRALRAGK